MLIATEQHHGGDQPHNRRAGQPQAGGGLVVQGMDQVGAGRRGKATKGRGRQAVGQEKPVVRTSTGMISVRATTIAPLYEPYRNDSHSSTISRWLKLGVGHQP
jgi:hypothetical protein